MSRTNITPLASLILKVVGVILILSSLLDYLTLAIPFNFLDRSWQVGFTAQMVDRGIIPMVGMSFLLIAYWIDENIGEEGFGFRLDLKFPAFILASILGLLFLILIPLHLSNLSNLRGDVLARIEQQAGAAEQKLQAEVQQLSIILQDEQQVSKLDDALKQIGQAIDNGTFQGRKLNPQEIEQLKQQQEQLRNIKALKGDPKKLEARLNELKNELRDKKLEQEKRAKGEALKQSLRIGLNSLMLAVGYIVIGWLGLQSSMSGSGTRRPRPPKPPKL